jgi:isomerase DpgB
MLGRIAGPELSVRRQLLNEATSSAYEDAIGAHLAACDRELRRIGVAAPERPGVAGGS